VVRTLLYIKSSPRYIVVAIPLSHPIHTVLDVDENPGIAPDLGVAPLNPTLVVVPDHEYVVI
jgi:hypothetical protein